MLTVNYTKLGFCVYFLGRTGGTRARSGTERAAKKPRQDLSLSCAACVRRTAPPTTQRSARAAIASGCRSIRSADPTTMAAADSARRWAPIGGAAVSGAVAEGRALARWTERRGAFSEPSEARRGLCAAAYNLLDYPHRIPSEAFTWVIAFPCLFFLSFV